MLRDVLVRIGYAALKAGLRVPEIPLVGRFSEQGHLLDLMNSLKINYVLDVGANKGWFAKHLRMFGYSGHIICFEPIRSDYEIISRLADKDPKWQVFNFALGAENSVKRFNFMKDVDGNTTLSSFLQPKVTNWVEKVDSVMERRVDDVLDEIIKEDARFFLKIDTQGYDLEVMKGCARWLNKVALLQSEISITPIYDQMPHYTQALEYYESLGFSLIDLHVVDRAPHGSVLEYDCVMARLEQF